MDSGSALHGELRRALVCLLVLLVGGATSLKNLKITVPERVRAGDSALLSCTYDLEGAQLYTIKWYLNGEEFYRYVPKKEPSQNTFDVKNIQVNVSHSNMQDVTLVNVKRKHTGLYSCEVSEDSPRYDTKLQAAALLVVDVPDTDPRIAVDKEHLSAGETLRANCTSGASRPAPNITWTLNGAPLNNKTMQFKIRTRTVPSGHEDWRLMDHSTDDKNAMFSSLGLETSGLFQDGRIRLRCFAEITGVYKASASIVITEDGPFLASITGDVSPRQSGGCSPVASPMLLALSLVLGLLLGTASMR